MGSPTLITTLAPRSPGHAGPLPVALLADIVGGLARAADLWRPHVAHDDAERVRVRLLATTAYEVWLLGWTPGQSVGLHDHGEANGAFVVVDGELTETSLSRRGLVDVTLRSGQSGRIPTGNVHDVANHSRRNATSIHAYSRPLSTMGYYAPNGSLERVEAIHEQDAVIDPAQLTTALHPARGHRPE